MSDIVRDRVLGEALAEIPLSGVSQTTLDIAAEKAGIGKRELQDAFPKGPVSLIEAFSQWADRRMRETMAASKSGPRMRDRVTAAVRARIEVLAPHRQAARRAAAFLAAPQNAPLGARLMMKSVDAMWRAAGDSSSDFSYYTKRAMLAGVYSSTLAYWFTDSSEHNTATWTFLDHRIGNVMQFEKLKGQAKDAFAKLPDPLGILNARRGSSRR